MRKGLLLKLKKLVSARNVGTSFLLGAFVLLVATYGVWQIQQLLSPDSGNVGIGMRIQLKSSDRKSTSVTTLDNSFKPPAPGTADDTPTYNYFGVTPLTKQGNDFKLFRIQGEVFYK